MEKKSAPAKSSGKSFSISESISYGFNFFKNNFTTFVKLGAVLFAINIASSLVTSIFSENDVLSIIWAIGSTVISILVQIGTQKILLELYDKKPFVLTRLYDQSGLLLRYLGATILYSLAVFVGFILLIIPGIYFAIKYQFYGFLIIDKKMGIMESLKKSSAMTEGVKWQLFLFGLAMALLNIGGALLLLVGLVITIPTTMMASVWVYRKLL